jgi:aryl-alcohol dehydrogenase-like predicted oxidoreductase
MTFGAPDWGCDEQEAHAILKRFLDGGGNSIDAADVYAGGRAEEIIGTFLQDFPREQVVLASKCYFPMGTQPNQYGLSRKHVMASCEASLRRLRTDYIDLYYLHGPDPIAPLDETLRAFDDLVRQGKVRYIGVSNLFAWQIAKASGVSARMNLEPLIAGQYIYSLIHREPEREVIPAAVDHGLGILCYGALGAGLLTGKYGGMTEPPKGSRMQRRAQIDGARFWHPKGFKVAQVVEQVSQKTGIPMAKLAIAWPLRRRFVASVIVGVRTWEQLASNMEPGDWNVPEDVWKTLEEQTRPEEEYLTWFNRMGYQRIFGAADFHDERAELP